MKIVTDISKNIDWIIRKSGYNSFTITFTQSASAYNISSYVFSLNIKKFNSNTNILALTEAGGEITNGGASGILTVILDETDSGLLDSNNYYWELRYIYATKNYTLLQGSAQVNSQLSLENVETSLSIAVNLTGTNLDAELTIVGSGGVGGGGTWGSITGTLSSQTDLQAALDLKSNLASPTFTGTPAAPTAAQGTNTTQLANTEFVQQEIQSFGCSDLGSSM